MPYRRNYPQTVAEILGDVKYKPAALRAVRTFARSRPWRGTAHLRRYKWGMTHADLCEVYGVRVGLVFADNREQLPSGASHYNPITRQIVLNGRLSVVTYLHEFAHALGKDERQACRWSINLFRRCFPRSFARCTQSMHMLLRPDRPGRPRRRRLRDNNQPSTKEI